MPAQQGVMSAYQLMPHTHKGIGQGGIIRNDDLYQSCGLRAYRNAAQLIPQVAITQILFEAEMYDIGGDFNADGVNSEFTTPDNGFYYIQSTQNIILTAAPLPVYLYIYKDGAFEVFAHHTCSVVGTFAVSIAALLELIAGEVIDIRIWHGSAAGRNLVGGSGQNWLSIFKIGE